VFQSIASQFNAGGSFMWVLLSVLGFALAVVLERTIYYLIVCRGNSSKLTQQVIGAVQAGQIESAKTVLKKRSSPLHVMLRIAVDRFAAGGNRKQIEDGVAEAAIKEIPKMSKHLSYLNLFANIATLLGLLGTVAGLQTSFGSLASVDAAQKAAMLSNGISVAMNTTAFGLVVAVPCMIMYTILNAKQQSLVKDIDQSLVKVVNSMESAAV